MDILHAYTRKTVPFFQVSNVFRSVSTKSAHTYSKTTTKNPFNHRHQYKKSIFLALGDRFLLFLVVEWMKKKCTHHLLLLLLFRGASLAIPLSLLLFIQCVTRVMLHWIESI